MKKAWIIICSFVLVGCGNSYAQSDVVTREEVNEIVEQAIQEHDEQLYETELDSEENEDVLKTIDSRFVVVDNTGDHDIVNTIVNYKDYYVEESEDGAFLYYFICKNTTGRTISSCELYLGSTSGARGSVLVENVHPDEDMVFELRDEFQSDIEFVSIDKIEYEE